MNSHTVVFHPHAANMALPGIHRVGMDRPLAWLAAGADDMLHAWPVSLGYGAAFALVGFGLMQWAWATPHLALTLTSGFLFMAPLLATVFYCLSHFREHHHHLPSVFAPLVSWRHNPISLGLFAMMLAFILSAWERISAILVGLFLNGSGIGSVADLISPAMAHHLDFVAAYLVFGGVLSLMVFSLSVVSLPMLLHRRVDFATALVTSFMTTRLNFGPMLLWGAILAACIAFGFATHFIAMVIVFPLLGHASWHAYRDLVERE